MTVTRANTATPDFVVEEDLPLSAMQTAILAETDLDPEAARYNVPLAFAVTGPLDGGLVARAVDALVARHEILRTIYVERAGDAGVAQAIADEVPGLLQVRAGVDPADFSDLCRREAARPFDLSRDPPLRAVLFTNGTDRHALSLVFHHVAVDGWSVRLILEELTELYGAARAGRPAALAEPDLQYADWAAWQGEQLDKDAAEGMATRVLDRFAGLNRSLSWPDRQRHGLAEMVPFTLEPDLLATLDAAAKRSGATLYSLLAGAFALLVARLSGETAFVFGTPVALRDRAELQGVVGCFVNTVPVRVDLDPTLAAGDLPKVISRAVVDALETRDLPLSRVAGRLPGQGPVLRAFFNFDDAAVPLPRFDGCALSVIDCDRGTAKFDLMLSMLRAEGEVRAAFDLASDVFPPETRARCVDLYRRLLARMVEDPTRPLATIGAPSVDERAEILALGQGEERPLDLETIDRRIARVAADTPTAVAVTGPGGHLSFADLDADATRLAVLLAENGVGRGDRVLVVMERDLSLPTAMLAAMRAGAAYVPLEPAIPDARLADILADARPAAVVCDHAALGRLRALVPEGLALIGVDGRDPTLAHPGGSARTIGGPRPGDVAYMIYTSGSTGKPKGVMVPHDGLNNYLDWAAAAYEADRGKGTAIVTSTAFDATVLSFWVPLMLGRPLVLMPKGREIESLSSALVEGAGYGFVKLTPAHLDLLGEMAPPEWQGNGTAVFVVGGEALKSATVASWLAEAPGVRIVNEYGPTETVVGCCVHEAAPGDLGGATLPIGRPIANTSLYVLNEALDLVLPGMTGELYIGGAGVAWGYWRRPGLTAERFVADPFSPRPGARMYRTGDIVRQRPDGVFEYLGRADDQIKLHGYRVEPGEIEAAIRAVEGVVNAAVVALGEGDDKRLIAYRVGGPPDEDLRGQLVARLPDYMVPAHFVALAELPLTDNGKVDRRRLAASPPPSDGAVETKGPAVAEPLVQEVMDLWRTILADGVDPDTDFFAAGGTSLKAIRLLARIKRTFDVVLGYPDLLAAATPRRLAALIADRRAQAEVAAPRALEAVLAVVRPALGDAAIGPDDDLLAAGLTSLTAIRVLARLRRALGRSLPADTLFLHRTPRAVALALDALDPPEVTPTGNGVSPGERQLWLESQVEGGASSYVMQAAFVVERAGAALPAVEGLALALGRRHPVLSTAYDTVSGDVVVRALEVPHPTRARRVTSDATGAALDNRTRAEARADAAQPFDLATGETWRLTEVVGGEATAYVLTLHHIVSDATSLAVLLRDLIAGLSGRALVPPAALYRTFAAERAAAASAAQARQLAHWTECLRDAPAPLDLPLDRPRHPGHRAEGAAQSFTVPGDLAARVSAFARDRGIQTQAVVMAAYATLLFRLTRAEDLVIGVPVSERPEGYEEVVGLFLNTLPLRVRPTAEASAETLARAIAAAMGALLGHRDVQFAQIVEAVKPPRVAGRTPLLHTVLDWQDDADALEGLEVGDAGVRPVEIDVTTAPFDLALTLRREPDGSLLGGLIHDRALLDPETVAVWGRSFVRLLEAMVGAPETALARLPAVADQDLPKVLLEGPTNGPLPTLDAVLARSLDRYGDRPALEGDDRTLTYAALWAEADRVEPGPGRVAVVETADPARRVVEALAALKAGRVLALIDPALPPARVAAMRAVLARFEAEAPPGHDDATRAAYIQFTSGSTGQPKGAVLSRRGLANLLLAIPPRVDLALGVRCLQVAAPAFDAWIWEVFTCLAGGGTLVLAEREALRPGPPLVETLAARRVTHATLTPSVIAALGTADLPDLRVLIAAGEALSSDLAERWGRGRRLINAYGPCEVTVCATLGDYHPGEGTPGIGGPIAGTAALVVDRQGQWAIPGSDGELWIGGAGVGLGYVGLEALTKDRFVTDPRPGVEGRVYRSGDVVRVRANGGLRFIGRDDRQVKVRGTRIELDEIERLLQGLPGVAHAAVRVVADGLGAPLVAAWASGPGATSADALRRGLAEHLPETMLPSRLIVVDTMPMTATGKVDRMALSDPGPEADGTGEDAPVGPMETAIAAKMAEVLGLSHPPGRFGNFFTLGGHSILAVRLAATLSEALGQAIPLPRLFAHPTPAALAAALAARPSEAPRGIRTLRAGSGRVGFLVHAVDGTGQAYAPLAAAWPTDRRLVAVEQERDFETLEELAAAHAAEIDRVVEAEAPGAPVDLLGWSLGATVAAAIAGHLRTRGRTVALVVVDATPPSPTATSGVEEDALAEAAAAVGGGADLVARVRRNVRLAEGAALGRLPGGVGVIRAEGTPRPEATPDLGWGAVFDRVEVASAVGDHLTVLKADPATLAARIEAMWQAMGKEGTPCAT